MSTFIMEVGGFTCSVCISIAELSNLLGWLAKVTVMRLKAVTYICIVVSEWKLYLAAIVYISSLAVFVDTSVD